MTDPPGIPPPALPSEAPRPAPPRPGGPYDEWDTGRPSAAAWIALVLGVLAPVFSWTLADFCGPIVMGTGAVVLAILEAWRIANRKSSPAGRWMTSVAFVLGMIAIMIGLATFHIALS